MEISCKASSGKSICAFPDVCFTPPQTPATPPGVPIPYPNTAMASDTDKGSKKVKAYGKPVMLKNKSNFKKSVGDQAGCAPKKGIVTSKNGGKASFSAWSMNVKIEGENAVRNLDIMLQNHGSGSNTPPWPFMGSMSLDMSSNACNKSGDAQKVTDNCKKPPEKDYSKACCTARKCMLVPYSPNQCCKVKGKKMTPHHVVLKSQFHKKGNKADSLSPKYNPDKAPCICVPGTGHSTGKHGKVHTATNNLTVNHASVINNVEGKTINAEARWTAAESEAVGAKAVAEVTGCDEGCIKAQVREGHRKMGVGKTNKIRPSTAGAVTDPPTSTSLTV